MNDYNRTALARRAKAERRRSIVPRMWAAMDEEDQLGALLALSFSLFFLAVFLMEVAA